MKFLDIIIFFAVILVLLNSLFIVYFYKNFWFVVVSLFFGISVVVFVNFIKPKVILYKSEKLSKLKLITSLILVISVFNFSFSILGYSLNFIKNRRLKNFYKKETDFDFITTEIKGKVFSLLDRNVFVSNAKITLIHKDTNMTVDIFYTDFKGEFEYKLGDFLKEGGNFELIIEHANYEKYTTNFKVYPFCKKELEIFLQPKKLLR